VVQEQFAVQSDKGLEKPEFRALEMLAKRTVCTAVYRELSE
jgi:hypothetical protein